MLTSRTVSIFIACFATTLLGIAIISADQFGLVIYRLITDGALCIAWLLAAMGVGAAVHTLVLRRKNNSLLDHVISIGLGIGLLSLIILMLGLAGLLNRATAWGIVIAGIVLLIVVAKRRFARPEATPSKWNWFWLLAMPSLSIALVSAIAPPGVLWGDEPNGYDVLEYHLQVPREWYEAGRISALTHNVYSYFPFNVEMHYLLAMHLRGGPWNGMYLAQLMHLAMTTLSVVAIYAIAKEPAGPPAAVFAALSAAAAPWLLLLAPIAYNDGGLLLFGALSIGLTWRAIRQASTWRDFAIAGAFAGFACGTKLTAVPMLLVGVPVCSVIFTRQRALIFLVAALLMFSPWMIRNIAWAKNPFFPEATQIFGRGPFTDVQQQRWRIAHSAPPAQQPVAARFRTAGQQILLDWRFGFLLIPAAVAAILFTFGRRGTIFLALLLIFFAIVWIFFTHLQSRFFVLAIPVIALSLATAINARPALRTGAACVVALSMAIGLWQWQQRYGSEGIIGKLVAGHALGVERLDWLGADLTSIPVGAHVELIGDARAFAYSRPVQYRTVFDTEDWSPGDAEFLVIDPNEIRRLSATYYNLPSVPAEWLTRSEPFILRRDNSQ